MLHKDLTGADLHINKVHATTHVEIGTDPLVLAESQVADLVADLADKVEIDDARLSDARVPTAHDHAESGITNLVTDLSGKAPLVHGHVKADVADFPVSMPASDVSTWAKEETKPDYTPSEIGSPSGSGSSTGSNTGDQTLSGLGAVATGDSRLSDARTPTAHTHVKASITDFPTLGTGDVVGPAAAVDGHLVVFDTTTGKLIRDGGAISAGGGSVTAVTGTPPIVSSEGTTPVISLPAATNAAPGHATAAQIAALEAATAARHAIATIGTGNGLSITGQAISLAPATASAPGAATAVQITKLDGIAAGAKVGDVVGPASATDGHLAVYDSTTGKLIKDGGAITAAGLALIDDADAAAQRATLGVLPLAGGTLTGNIGLTLTGGGNLPNPNEGAELDYVGDNLTFRNLDAGGFTLGSIKMVQSTGYFVNNASMVFSVINASGIFSERIRINRDGNIWASNDISALSFTDRTPIYEGDALAELIKIKGRDGKIDHNTLPAFARHVMTLQVANETEKEQDGKAVMVETQEEGRDLGAMISMLTTAIKQLNDRLLAVEKKK